ncbi:MAG: phosphate ABC transporter permease subunit PstC [Verrucomicrobiales bacterium]|nr:phosphate ABC transporter permease subunit PstC [Verrucomicrobiales bacterium]
MAVIEQSKNESWTAIRRGQRKRPLEWLVERGIYLVSLSAIVMVFLIFVFVGREALPVVLGTAQSAAVSDIIPVEQFDSTPPAKLRKYLELSEEQFKTMDRESKLELMNLKIEAAKEVSEDKDSRLNTIGWRSLLLPHQWTGYDKPEYIWQPVSMIHKYNVIPLLIGSLKATVVALLFSVPLALGAALYVSQLAGPKTKEWLKPSIEMLAGIPSVVLGFFALLVMASALQSIFGYESRLNAFVAGIALGLAVIPVVFSIAEDALTSVPRSYVQGALALGSTPWQATWKIVLPAAIPGVFAAVVLGFGRAIGETMVVLMASGNASIVSASLFDSTRTMTATIAAELAETVFGEHHYRMLFLLGAVLFAVTFLSNLLADQIIHRLKNRLEGRV